MAPFTLTEAEAFFSIRPPDLGRSPSLQPMSTMAAARVPRLTAGRRACPIGQGAGSRLKSLGVGATREHAAPGEAGRPVINRPAPC